MNWEGGENPWEVEWLEGENREVNCLEAGGELAGGKVPGNPLIYRQKYFFNNIYHYNFF